MRQLRMTLGIFALTLLVAGFAGATAIQDTPAPAQSAEAKTAQGELVKVDADNHMFTIKQENGEEMQFQYDATTEVQGSQTSVQGLATQTGTRVTVQYTESADKKLARRIEIQKSDR